MTPGRPQQEAKNLRPDTHRRDNIVPESGFDTYRRRGKLLEPTVCPECEAVFQDGRWTWTEEPPSGSTTTLCSACERARDDNPAGFLTVSGPFLRGHRESVINTIENQAARETGEHPMHRILERAYDGEDLVITTSDIHLPRRIGEALRRAYKGTLSYHYLDEDQILRATWVR